MAVRKLKAKQRGHRCSWCVAVATHRGFGFVRFACHDHLRQLEEWDRQEQAPDYSDAAFQGGYQ